MINTNEGEPVPCDDNKLLESAEIVIENLKQHIQQKQAEIEKYEKNWKKLGKKAKRCVRINNIVGGVYHNMNACFATLFGLASGFAAWLIGELKLESVASRLGGTRGSFDEIKAYLLNHPEELQKAQEQLGSTDINFVSGYLTGDDSLANALFAQTGLREFFAHNADIATNEALKLGGGVFVGLIALGLGGYLVGKFADDKRYKYAGEQYVYWEKIEDQKENLKYPKELLIQLSHQTDLFKSELSRTSHPDHYRNEVKKLVGKATEHLKSDKELKR